MKGNFRLQDAFLGRLEKVAHIKMLFFSPIKNALELKKSNELKQLCKQLRLLSFRFMKKNTYLSVILFPIL
jgi:branched-subunit amino acid transport protein AzlD